MTGDDHDWEEDLLVQALWKALEAGMKRDDDRIERIEKQAEDSKQKLEDGNKWPD